MKNIVIAILILIIFSAISILYAKVDYYKDEVAKVNLYNVNEPKTYEKETVKLYFPGIPDIELVENEVEIEGGLNKEEKIKRVINGLIEGPKESNLLPVIPQGSKLNSVIVLDKAVYLDFSKEFVENHPGGSLGEYNTIYSIINSVTSLGGIEDVYFTVEGEILETYKGHIEFSNPF
jgi:germination protein M